MATLAALRTAVASTLSAGFTAGGLTQINVYAIVDTPVPPCVVVRVLPNPDGFTVTMGRGIDTWLFDLDVLADSADPVVAQTWLDPLVSGSGATSIRQIMFTTPAGSPRTLGLSGTDAHIAGLVAYGGNYTIANIGTFVGATLRLIVHTSGTA